MKKMNSRMSLLMLLIAVGTAYLVFEMEYPPGLLSLLLAQSPPVTPTSDSPVPLPSPEDPTPHGPSPASPTPSPQSSPVPPAADGTPKLAPTATSSSGGKPAPQQTPTPTMVLMPDTGGTDASRINAKTETPSGLPAT
jgi:hypothetical protein